VPPEPVIEPAEPVIEPVVERVGERRPGGRSARVRSAVLEATVAALADEGYEHLGIDAVAARAGVHKTTVYRRWPTKAELVADATRERAQQMVPVPDTGSLAGDLETLAAAIAANVGSDVGRRMARTLVAAALVSDDVARVQTGFWSERFELTTAIVDRAVVRGELPAGTDARLVIESLIGPLYVRLLLTGGPVDRAYAARVAAFVTAAVT
jgi:AcrR family transcriptional regulator